MISALQTTIADAEAPPACDHDGTCHGELRSGAAGVLDAVVVCAACGVTVEHREALPYAPAPELAISAAAMQVAA